MAQIKKAQRGLELTQIDSLIKENDALLNDPNIDENLKANARAVIQFSQNVINQEEFTPRDKRLYQLGIAQKVKQILNGEQAYSESTTGDADKNIFGFYNRRSELPWMINETVKRALPKSSSSTQLTTSEGTKSDEQNIIFKTRLTFNPAEGFNSHTLSGTTTDYKIKKFANHLIQQLEDYLSKDSESYIIDGLSEKGLKSIPQSLGTLRSIISRTTTDNDILTLGDIVTSLGNEDLTSLFESYFSDKLDTSAPTVVTGNQSSSSNPYTAYSTLETQDGEKLHIQLDPTKDDYQQLTIADKDGKVKSKYDLTMDTDIQKLVDLGIWNQIAQKIKSENKARFNNIEDYTEYGGLKGIDFSNHFSDESIRFVDPKDFNFDENLWIPYEDWFEDWASIKPLFKYNGNADIDRNGNPKSNQYAKSIGWEEADLSKVDSLDESTIQQIFGGVGDDDGDINGSSGLLSNDKTFKYLLTDDNPETSLSSRLAQFINLYVKAEEEKAKNPNKAEFEIDSEFPHFTEEYQGKELGDRAMDQIKSDPRTYLQILKYAIKMTQNPEDKRRLIRKYNIVLEENKSIFSAKSGGIIKAFQGSSLNNTNKSVRTTTGKTIVKSDPMSQDNQTGAGLALLSAVLDLGLMFDPEPYSSGIGSAIVLGLNQAADHYLGASTLQRVGDGAIDTLAGAASVVPLLGNATQAGKLAFKCGRLGKILGIGGAGLSSVLTGLGIKDAADHQLFSKFLNDPFSLSKEEATTLVRIATGCAGFARSIQGISRANRGVMQKTDTPEFIQAKNKEGEISFVPIDKSKVSAAEIAQEEALNKLHFWNLQKKKQANIDFAKAITPEGHTPITGLKGKAKTDVNYVVDPMKANEKTGFMMGHPYRSHGYAAPETMKPYDPNQSLGNTIRNWWSEKNFKLVPNFMRNYSVIGNHSVKIGDDNVKLIGLPKSKAEGASKQFFGTSIMKQKPITDVPAEIKAISKDMPVYKDVKTGVYIYVDPKKKDGGKLQRLTDYINK